MQDDLRTNPSQQIISWEKSCVFQSNIYALTCCLVWKKARIHNSNPTFSMLQRCVNVGICVHAKVRARVCVSVCLRQQLSMSWCIWSSGNHSLSMYGSSCGSPCLILHASRKCHNTFTSHSSTSSQGQPEKRVASVPACAPAKFLHSCSKCMHTQTVYACMHTTRLLICSHSCLFMFIHMYEPFCIPSKSLLLCWRT